MKFRVIDTRTGEDVTGKEDWVIDRFSFLNINGKNELANPAYYKVMFENPGAKLKSNVFYWCNKGTLNFLYGEPLRVLDFKDSRSIIHHHQQEVLGIHVGGDELDFQKNITIEDAKQICEQYIISKIITIKEGDG